MILSIEDPDVRVWVEGSEITSAFGATVEQQLESMIWKTGWMPGTPEEEFLVPGLAHAKIGVKLRQVNELSLTPEMGSIRVEVAYEGWRYRFSGAVEMLDRDPVGGGWWLRVSGPAEHLEFVAPDGSIERGGWKHGIVRRTPRSRVDP